MRIEMQKFGNILNSRQSGREAFLRAVQIVNGSSVFEEIILDFSGVEVLTPSFADEFLHLLKDKYQNRIINLENTESATVKEILQSIKNESKRQ